MFMTKSKKMRKVVERELYLVEEKLKSNPISDTLIAREIQLKSILYYFDNIDKVKIKGY